MRPTVGDKVKVLKKECPIKGIATIIKEDRSTMPFKLKQGSIEWWVMEEDVELVKESIKEPSSLDDLKVGDTVRIKSIEWYEANKDDCGGVNVPLRFVESMSKYCGKVFKIVSIHYPLENTYYTLEDPNGLDTNVGCWKFSKEMFDLPEERPSKKFLDIDTTATPIDIPLIQRHTLLTNIKVI